VPTKRRRIDRKRTPQDITPAELQWLTGEPQPGANPFWQHARGTAKAARARALLDSHDHLIPAGRLPALLDDVRHWDD
jgi:hypothetical protein